MDNSPSRSWDIRSSVGAARLGRALAVLLTACSGARSQRGVERPHTGRPEAGRSRSAIPSCRGDSVGDVWAPRGFCVTRYADGLDRPRHLVVAPDGGVFVATRAGVIALWDADQDGVASEEERATLTPGEIGMQGIALSPDGAFLYYAGDPGVLRIPFRAGLRRSPGAPQVVIHGLPATISHPYKALTFDREGRLYVAVGSSDNLTPGEGARIVRFAIPAALPEGGMAYGAGEAFATGLRNAEALTWDREGRLWAFVNGRDYLRPPGTPESFYLDHPGDWIFRLAAEPGRFYGFPHCWVLGPVAWGERRDPASQWADPEAAAGHDDAWCQDATHVQPAAGALPAHVAPLGAVTYTGTLFPSEYQGNLIVTSHGSWNRHEHQIGRALWRVVVSGDRVTEAAPFVAERAGDGNRLEGSWSVRPVGVAQGPEGALYVTSDERGEILRVGYGRE
ncbi:MAG: Lsorbosone dehydrogenase [Myxococcaceae bacterium]|nr:Lsorbosone dehydrogenase [Myxococcaceae bacterium]